MLVHTGQHYTYEMSQVFFEDLQLPEPDYHLGAGSGSRAEQTGRIMTKVDRAVLQEVRGYYRPDGGFALAAVLAGIKEHTLRWLTWRQEFEPTTCVHLRRGTGC